MRGFSPLFKTQNLSLKAISKYSIAFRTQITAFNFRIQVILPTPLTVGYPSTHHPQHSNFNHSTFNFQKTTPLPAFSLLAFYCPRSTDGPGEQKNDGQWTGRDWDSGLNLNEKISGRGRGAYFHFIFFSTFGLGGAHLPIPCLPAAGLIFSPIVMRPKSGSQP